MHYSFDSWTNKLALLNIITEKQFHIPRFMLTIIRHCWQYYIRSAYLRAQKIMKHNDPRWPADDFRFNLHLAKILNFNLQVSA